MPIALGGNKTGETAGETGMEAGKEARMRMKVWRCCWKAVVVLVLMLDGYVCQEVREYKISKDPEIVVHASEDGNSSLEIQKVMENALAEMKGITTTLEYTQAQTDDKGLLLWKKEEKLNGNYVQVIIGASYNTVDLREKPMKFHRYDFKNLAHQICTEAEKMWNKVTQSTTVGGDSKTDDFSRLHIFTLMGKSVTKVHLRPEMKMLKNTMPKTHPNSLTDLMIILRSWKEDENEYLRRMAGILKVQVHLNAYVRQDHLINLPNYSLSPSFTDIHVNDDLCSLTAPVSDLLRIAVDIAVEHAIKELDRCYVPNYIYEEKDVQSTLAWEGVGLAANKQWVVHAIIVYKERTWLMGRPSFLCTIMYFPVQQMRARMKELIKLHQKDSISRCIHITYPKGDRMLALRINIIQRQSRPK